MVKPWLSRRDFLNTSTSTGLATSLAVGAGLPASWLKQLAANTAGGERILIVLQLSGGNDGLNTVVPYRNEAYRKARPKLGMKADEIVKINDEIGLHPQLKSFEPFLSDGRMSVVQGVGYPSPNRSHFESMDIWHSCQDKIVRNRQGWLGRWISGAQTSGEQTNVKSNSLGLHLGSEQQPLALSARGVQVPSIASADQFKLKVQQSENAIGSEPALVDSTESNPTNDSDDLLNFVQSTTQLALAASERLSKALSNSNEEGDFPKTDLGEKLKIISRLILAGLETRVYYVSLDGFDTHSQQPLAHAGLMRQWSEAVNALLKRLKEAGESERVLVMTFSEFGRRVAENASEGTDHGAAAPMFFCGPKLPKQFIGSIPSLTDLEDGDLKFHTDFRSVYAAVIEQWFKTKSEPVLGSKYEPIALC